MRKLTNKEFLFKSKRIHNGKYLYLSTYENSRKKLKIMCNGCGLKFYQIANAHLSGQGCRLCVIEKRRNNICDLIIKFCKIHKNKYDYKNTKYKNINTKICIICPSHGNFFQIPKHHLKGHGCPKCKSIVSKSEMEFLNYLKIKKYNKNRQVLISRKKIDGFDDKTNTIYEFLGDYWHGNPEKFKSNEYNKTCHKSFGQLYKNTFEKLNKLKDLGYNVKYIWESDWKKFKKDLILFPKIIIL